MVVVIHAAPADKTQRPPRMAAKATYLNDTPLPGLASDDGGDDDGTDDDVTIPPLPNEDATRTAAASAAAELLSTTHGGLGASATAAADSDDADSSDDDRNAAAPPANARQAMRKQKEKTNESWNKYVKKCLSASVASLSDLTTRFRGAPFGAFHT